MTAKQQAKTVRQLASDQFGVDMDTAYLIHLYEQDDLGRRISRVLSRAIIYLGHASQHASSGLPENHSETGRFSSPI